MTLYSCTDYGLAFFMLSSALGGGLIVGMVVICFYESKYRKYLALGRNRQRMTKEW